jgi:thiamine biosynthesis lipoprotein
MRASPERRFRVMGSDAHVLVVGGRVQLVDDAARRLADLERRWSRFLLDSEISKCNALAGRPVLVSLETVRLVSLAVEGWKLTNHMFDPTVLTAVCDAGYDRDFHEVVDRAVTHTPPRSRPAAGCAGIVCDEQHRTVTLPADVQFDPGGIGKGLAADIVTEELIAAGAAGALASVGGDVRVRGESPDGSAWTFGVDDPMHPGVVLLRLGLDDGAVATSSRLQRRWQTQAGAAHHLIDPSTGAPAVTPLVAVSAVTRDGWWAEVVAKAVLIGGWNVDAGEALSARLVTIAEDGAVDCDDRIRAVAA